MAEGSQAALESMAVELNLLQRYGVFKRSEVRAIVRQRTKFEYRTRRSRAEKLDFIRYLQFERRLERLRQKRLGKITGSTLNPIVKRGGSQHIKGIYERTLLRFAGDVNIWLSYVAFAQNSLGPRAASAILARALRLHPNKPKLWSLASKFELELNSNIRNARSLLQRGIRINPENVDLYLDYTKLELLIQKHAEISQTDELGDEKTEQEKQESKTPFMSCGVARVIYEEAITKIPKDLSLRIGFLSVLSAFQELSGVNELENDIIKRIETDFNDDPEAWSALAEWECRNSVKSGGDGLKEAEKVWEKAVKIIKTEQIWDFRAAFIASKTSMDIESTLDSDSSKHVAKVCEMAHNSDLASERMYELWLSCAATLEDHDLALEISQKATIKWPKSGKLWLARIALTEDEEEATKLLHEAIHSISKSENKNDDCLKTLPLWNEFIRRLCKSHTSFDLVLKTINDAFGKLSAIHGTKETHDQAISTFAVESLHSLIHSSDSNNEELKQENTYEKADEKLGFYDVSNIRAMYSSALNRSSCLKNHDFCIEVINFEMKFGKDYNKLQSLFRRILDVNALGTTADDIWLMWHKLEQENGNMKQAANVYRNAKSTLIDCSSFLESFSS